MALKKWFHITNPSMYMKEKGLSSNDKTEQTKWLIDRIQRNYKKVWKLGKMYTIDKLMIGYKEKYCSLH
jgi:hypothetical protein